MLNNQLGDAWGVGKKSGTSLVFIKLFFFIALLLSPGYAAPPVPFGAWSNQGGTITASCPAGYTCTDNVTSNNMVQRLLSNNATGETYVQVIIDENFNGTYQSETFVNASNDSGIPIPLVDPDNPTFSPVMPPIEIIPDNNDANNQTVISGQNRGVATQMSLSQTGVASDTFDYSYSVYSGWGITPNQPSIDIQFRVTDTTAQGIFMDYSFFLEQRSNANGQVTGRYFGLDQMVRNSAVIGPGNGGGRDDHMFVLRRARGDYINAGSASLPPPGGMGGMGGTLPNPAGGTEAPPFGITPNPQPTPFPNPPGAPTGNPAGMGGGGGAPPGGSVAWNTGNEVQVIWIGQVCPGCVIAGMGGMGGGNGFSFQQYENITNGQSAATRSYTSSAPFTWTDPPFGPQPPGL